jgi:putative transposase
LRNSLEFASWKDYKSVIQALKAVCRAGTVEAAQVRLEEFAASTWGQKYPTIVPLWQRHWEEVIPFLAYPQEVLQVIYTTNVLESLPVPLVARLRKIIKNRGHFPNDEATTKLLYLALRNITQGWTMPPRTWKAAINQFAILFEDRLLERLG